MTQEKSKWFHEQEQKAITGFKKHNFSGFMEIKFSPTKLLKDADLSELKNFVQKSQIQTFGWPIGVILENRFQVNPHVDGKYISTEISIRNEQWGFDENKVSIFDYWSLKTDGSFYSLSSLFEDTRKPNCLFFDTRIIKITEVFLFARNLYSEFNLEKTETIEFLFRHGGLKNRLIMPANQSRIILHEYRSDEDEVGKPRDTIFTNLNEIDSNIASLVKRVTDKLFEQFSFFNTILEQKIIDEIVINFKNGKIV